MPGKKYRVDAIDRRIIAELGKDARLSLRALAVDRAMVDDQVRVELTEV